MLPADKYILQEDHLRGFAPTDEAIRTKALFELERRVRNPDGSIGWVLSRPFQSLVKMVKSLSGSARAVTWFSATKRERRSGQPRSDTALTIADHACGDQFRIVEY